MTTIISNNELETRKIGYEYAKNNIKFGDIVLINGDLGVGKTQFIKGVGEYFNIYNIHSPTYTYINIHKNFFCHFDCYKIQESEDAINMGFNDYFNEHYICLIEWGNNIKDIIPKYAKNIYIKKCDYNSNVREIII